MFCCETADEDEAQQRLRRIRRRCECEAVTQQFSVSDPLTASGRFTASRLSKRCHEADDRHAEKYTYDINSINPETVCLQLEMISDMIRLQVNVCFLCFQTEQPAVSSC